MAELVTSSGKSGKRSSLKKIPPRIDLTAMVDLAFLLITFFILSTTLVKPKAMDVAMPVKARISAGWPESRTMTICLGKNNQVMWYMGLADKPLMEPQIVNYSKDGLRTAIVKMESKILKTTGKPMAVILKPSDHSVYGNVVNAIDELNITSVASYAVTEISPKDIDMLKQKNAY